MVLYAVLSLTLVRMVPVALACLGAGLDRATVLFIGWFGPRGLATLVFALLALEELGPDVEEAVATIGVTVLLSVLAHGLTAAPLAGEVRRDAPRRVHALIVGQAVSVPSCAGSGGSSSSSSVSCWWHWSPATGGSVRCC